MFLRRWLSVYCVVDLLRYTREAIGIAAAIAAMQQTMDIHILLSGSKPRNNARTASITRVIGWFSANTLNAVGMPSVGTKAELAKVEGKRVTCIDREMRHKNKGQPF